MREIMAYRKQADRGPFPLVPGKDPVLRGQLCVDEETLTTLAAKLDPLAAHLLWHVWRNGYANLEELVQLIGADSHSEVLLKIKSDINPTAEQLLGAPILDFRKRSTDTATGKTVLFSWWIAGRKEKGVRTLLCARKKGPDPFFSPTPIDLFDEDDHVDVVVELPGARPEDIRASVECLNEEGVEDTRLVLHAAVSDFTGNGRKIHEQIPLPGAIQADAVHWKLNNGVLHVRLRRPPVAVGAERGARANTE